MPQKRCTRKSSRLVNSSESDDDNMKQSTSFQLVQIPGIQPDIVVEDVIKKECVEPELVCLSSDESSGPPIDYSKIAKRLTDDDLKAECDSNASTIPEPMEVDDGMICQSNPNSSDTSENVLKLTSFSQVCIKTEPSVETHSTASLQNPSETMNVEIKQEPIDDRQNLVIEKNTLIPKPEPEGTHFSIPTQNPPKTMDNSSSASQNLSHSNFEMNANPLLNVVIKKEPMEKHPYDKITSPPALVTESANKTEEHSATTSSIQLNQVNHTFDPNIRIKTESPDDREITSHSNVESTQHKKASKRELKEKLNYVRQQLRKRIKIQPSDDVSNETTSGLESMDGVDQDMSSAKFSCKENRVNSLSENCPSTSTSCKQTGIENDINFSTMSIKDEFLGSKQNSECIDTGESSFQNPVVREHFSTDILKYFSVVYELHAHDVEAAAKCLTKYEKKERDVLFCSSTPENREHAPSQPNRNRGILFEKNTVGPSNVDPEEDFISNFELNFSDKAPARITTELPPLVPGIDSAIPKVSSPNVCHSDSSTVHLPEKPIERNTPDHVFTVSEVAAACASNIPPVSHPYVGEKDASVMNSGLTTEELYEILATCSNYSTNVQPNQNIPGSTNSSLKLNSSFTASQHACMENGRPTEIYYTSYQPPSTDRVDIASTNFRSSLVSPMPPSSNFAQCSFQGAHRERNVSKENNLQFNGVQFSNNKNTLPLVEKAVPSIMPSSSTSLQPTFQAETSVSRKSYLQPITLDANVNRNKVPKRVFAADCFLRKNSRDPRCGKNNEPMDISLSNEQLQSISQDSASKNILPVPTSVPVQNNLHAQASSNNFSTNAVISRNECVIYSATRRTYPESSSAAVDSFAIHDPYKVCFDRRKGERNNQYLKVGKENINSYFVYLVLEWNPTWLFTQEETGVCPPICDSYPSVNYFYSNETEYYNTYIPLHLLSVWLRMYDCWRKHKDREFICRFHHQLNSRRNEFIAFTQLNEFVVIPKRDDIVLCKCWTTQELTFLRVLDVQKKNRMPEEIPAESGRTLRITFESLRGFIIGPKGCFSIYILFNVSISILQNDSFLSPNQSLKDLVLNPPDSSEQIAVIQLNPNKKPKSHRDDILNTMASDRISVVLINTPDQRPYDNILLILYLVYKLKDNNKILICMKNEESFIILVKRLIDYNPVLVIRSKEIHSKDFDKFKEHTLEAKQSQEERNAFIISHSIFVTTFSAFQANDKTLLANENLVCIINESHLCTEAETSIPLSLNVKKLLLLGRRDIKPVLPELLEYYGYNITLHHRLLKVK